MFSLNDKTSKCNVEGSPDQIKPEMTILISHFVSPQQFWYIELGELEAKANAVHQIERKLIGHCHESNQLITYDQNQYVIVEFLPCSPKKYIRGVVCQSLHESYLVMALDYGFTINCLGKNLWLLPKELQEKCLNIKEGRVASVIPLNGSHWSKEGLQIFDQKLEESSELSFIPLYNSLETNVGQLFWKEANQLVNAASYLVKNEYARLDANTARKSIGSTTDTFDWSFTEVNKIGTEPRLRVRKLIRQISTQVLSECNHRFDKLLQSRSFVIPKTALQISKVSRRNNKLDDSSSNPSKSKKPVDMNTDNKTCTRHNVEESLQNLLREAKTKLQLPIDKGEVNAITNKMNEITLSKKSLPEPPCSDKSRKIKYQSNGSIALAHSDSPVIPWEDMRSTQFGPTIEKAMKSLNFHTILPTQMYAWAHLMRQPGNSLLLIDGSNTGRSWSYLPALCSLVICGLQVINAKGGRLGPKAILLTDMENVNKLTNSCSNLMQGYNTPIKKTVNAYSYTEDEVITILLDSCGILITTVEKLKNLLDFQCKTGIKLFDLNYLELFVCDDYDRLCLSSNRKELYEVLQKFRGPSKYLFGLILVSQQWHAKVFSKLIKNLPRSPLILFGDFLQSAMYGGLKLETVIRNANEKLNQLLKYLSQQKLKRTMIYCKNQEELDILTKELTRKDFQCITLAEAQNQQSHQLLLVTDELVNESSHIAKKNIELLIHFSMPESWAKFAFRFYSMMDNIPNFLMPTANPVRILTYLILDHSNHHELLRLVQFFDAHGIEVDESIRQVIVTYQQEIEMMRPFCPYLLSGGECNQKQQCNKRHHFVQSDMQCGQSPMRQSGTIVRGKVCKVYDPVHISIWPVEYKPLGSSTWLHAPNSVSRLAMELAISMALKRQPHEKLKIGDICVVHQEDQFKRVRIVDLPNGSTVTVQVMDIGTELLKVKPKELFECEAKFQILPPLAMDVRLTRVEPRSEESFKWSAEAIKWVSNLLGDLKDQQFVQIDIDFNMLDVIYVNEIAVIEKCHTMRTTVHKLLLGKELISNRFGQQGQNIDMQLKTLVEQERDTNTNWPIEKNVEIAETIEEKDQFNEATELETRIDSKSGNINRLGLMMNAINEFLLKTDPSEQSKSKQNDFIKEELEEPIIEEPSELDIPTKFINSLINELNNNNSSCDTNSAIQLLQNILGDENPKSNKQKSKDNLEKVYDITSSKNFSDKVLPPQPTTDQTADALKCAIISDEAVCPNVKWRQSFYHIDLTFEQHVPQYKLIHNGNTIIYSVTETVPQQRCVLNLLGEVKILSEQQFGYNLRVKLAKLSLLNYWPSLLNSLYAQQHFRWLSYDTDRAQSPPLSKCHDLWQRYVNKDNFTYNANENDEDSVAPSSSDGLSERDVERCHSLTTDLFEDF